MPPKVQKRIRKHGPRKKPSANVLAVPVLRRLVENAELPGSAVKVLSACSGMDTECFALHNLKKKFSLEASCDISPAMARFSASNHMPKMWFDDVTGDDFKTRAPACDLMVAGFPCQPFSYAGLGQGESDTRGRGTVVWHLLEYAQSRLPAAIVLENVKGLVDLHPGTLLSIINGISQIREPGAEEDAYRVVWDLLDSQHFGLPQRRRRVYIVAQLKSKMQYSELYSKFQR